MKKFLACVYLIKNIGENAVKGRVGSYLAHLFVSIFLGVVPALAFVPDLGIPYLLTFCAMVSGVYVGLFLHSLSGTYPSAFALAPVSYRVRMLTVFVFALFFGAIFSVVFTGFILVLDVLLGGANALTGLVAQAAAIHPAGYVLLLSLIFGGMGIQAIVHYKTTKRQFVLRTVIAMLINIALVALLLFSPVIEQLVMYGSVIQEIDLGDSPLIHAVNYLAHPWVFVAAYVGVNVAIFAAGLTYSLHKARPSSL